MSRCSCFHCDEAPCIPACPVEGAIYKRDDGLVIIDPEKCTGCKACVDACPWGRIYFNEDLNIAQKCTGCAHLLDGGEWKVPRCADACPTEAIKFGEEEDFKDLIAKAEIMNPELGAKPRCYYLNIPKKFIAGTVYDPVEKEVIIGATCTLTGPKAATRRPRDHRRVRRFLVPRAGGRHLLAQHPGQGLRRQEVRQDQHGEGRQPGGYPFG